MKGLGIILSIGALLLVAAALLNSDESSQQPVNAGIHNQSSNSSASSASKAANFAPDFTLPLRGGGNSTLSDYRGDKAVIVDRFVKSKGIKFPIAIDTGQVANQYSVRYTNTHVLINKEGEVVRVVPGDLNESDFKSLLNV